MRKIHRLIILSFLAIFFVSCSDILEKEPLDAYSEMDIWSDGDMAEGFIMDTYRYVVKDLFVMQETDGWTDNISVNNNNGGSWRNLKTGNITNYSNMGWNQYTRIRACNMAIEKLTDNTEIVPAVRDKLLAEAKMLRGMIYFYMARRFGGVMLVDKVLTPEDEMKLPRCTEEELYEFIYNDIEDAIEGLPEEAPRGRFNKVAAKAYLTMIALRAQDYQEVIDAADEVEKYNYELESDYANMFNDYTTTISSKEIIFLYDSNFEVTTYRNTRIFRNTPNMGNGQLKDDMTPAFNDKFSAWPRHWPCQELVDDYLFKGNGAAVQKKGVEFIDQPARLMWQNRDDRFEVSIVRDSAQFFNSTLTFRRGGNCHWTSFNDTWGTPKTGYIFRKWSYEDEEVFHNHKLNWAEPLMRLGTVFLNKAEAYYRLGNLPKALEYMNKTRTTHGGLPALVTSDADEFWKFYKIERRVELLQENDRYWSLLRWGKYGEEEINITLNTNEKLHAMDIDSDGTVIDVIEGLWGITLNFEYPRRLYFPIPQGEREINDLLTQNPGW